MKQRGPPARDRDGGRPGGPRCRPGHAAAGRPGECGRGLDSVRVDVQVQPRTRSMTRSARSVSSRAMLPSARPGGDAAEEPRGEARQPALPGMRSAVRPRTSRRACPAALGSLSDDSVECSGRRGRGRLRGVILVMSPGRSTQARSSWAPAARPRRRIEQMQALGIPGRDHLRAPRLIVLAAVAIRNRSSDASSSPHIRARERSPRVGADLQRVVGVVGGRWTRTRHAPGPGLRRYQSAASSAPRGPDLPPSRRTRRVYE